MATSSLRKSFFETSSVRSSAIDEVYCGDFDFVMASSSWDARSVLLTEAAHLRSQVALLFNFRKRDDLSLSEKHEKALGQYLGRACETLHIHEIEATNVSQNWAIVKSLLVDSFQAIGRPLNIFIDLSTTPRYMSLGLLGFGLEIGILQSVTYAYSEGVYPQEQAGTDTKELFTEGGWRTVAIPGFSGEWEPHRIRHYIVSVGFEGIKTRQLVSRSEPDKVSLLFPDPPVQPGYEQRTFGYNEKLIQQFQIPEDRIVRAHAADVVATLQSLDRANLEDFCTENCLYVCCGTKPHSLALSLRSFLIGEPAVLYIVPESHRVSRVTSNGVHWRYTISDYSAGRGVP